MKETRYVNFLEFKEKLFQSWTKFETEIKDQSFHLAWTIAKFGSEHWLIHLLWSRIKQLNFQGFVQVDEDTLRTTKPECFKEIQNVLIIDDAAYSGTHTMMMMDIITSYGRPPKVTFHIVTPYVANGAINEWALSGFPGEIKIVHYMVEKINTIDWTGLDFRNYREYAEGESCLPNPFYFDHKIANEFGSFPLFYGPIIIQPVDRSMIEKVAQYHTVKND